MKLRKTDTKISLKYYPGFFSPALLAGKIRLEQSERPLGQIRREFDRLSPVKCKAFPGLNPRNRKAISGDGVSPLEIAQRFQGLSPGNAPHFSGQILQLYKIVLACFVGKKNPGYLVPCNLKDCGDFIPEISPRFLWTKPTKSSSDFVVQPLRGKFYNSKIWGYLFFLSVILFSSCARVPVKPNYEVIGPTVSSPQIISSPLIRQDTFHIVGPGETLWRISKMYDVGLKDVIAANNLESAEKINMGQELLIPKAAPIRPVVPLYNTERWKYIIVHHSATDEGNAFSLYQMHLRRGFWNGLGYQFIIDNGTFGKGDGQIEISPRWIKQQDGAHCKASSMNEDGIGICLVGNFSKERISAKQMESLIYLVHILREYYHIPDKNIMGHGEVPDAATECPGLKFPWDDFWFKLNSQQ